VPCVALVVCVCVACDVRGMRRGRYQFVPKGPQDTRTLSHILLRLLKSLLELIACALRLINLNRASRSLLRQVHPPWRQKNSRADDGKRLGGTESDGRFVLAAPNWCIQI